MRRRICPDCGQIVSEYTFFCTECGSKTVEYDETVKVKTKQSEEKKEKSQDNQKEQIENYKERFDGAGNQINEFGTGQNQESKGKKLIAVLSGVVVCLCIAIIVLILPGKSKKDTVSEEQTASAVEQEETEEIRETEDEDRDDKTEDGWDETKDYDETEDDSDDTENYDDTEDDNNAEDYDDIEEELDDTEDYEDTEEYNEQEIHEYELLVGDVSWSEAYQDCLDRGGYLVRINTEEEFDAILDQIYDEEKENIKFWIGGARGKDKKYHWAYGEDKEFGEDILNEDSQFEDYWLDGEPSFIDDATDTKENRMNMFYMKDLDRWVWNDVPDDILEAASFYAGSIGYICEY